MVNRPSVPEIITVNSEDLQTQIRDLLPSQNGFGSELQATNVITPVIDLTAAAQGTTTPISMQQALAFGSQSAFSINNTTTVIQNSPGFYRIFGVSNIETSATASQLNAFQLSDGLSTKTIWRHLCTIGSASNYSNLEFDFIVFLAAGESISGVSSGAEAIMDGSSRQIATGDGTLVQPSGFPL